MVVLLLENDGVKHARGLSPLADPRTRGFESNLFNSCHFVETQSGGEGGIRTHETLRPTRFPGELLQPLGHLSNNKPTQLWRRGWI